MTCPLGGAGQVCQVCQVRLCADFLPRAAADALFSALLRGLDWQQDSVRLFGREHPIPRRHQWYGDANAHYRWSGLTMRPLPWTAELSSLRDDLAPAAGIAFNSVLANLYRDGNDSMGWHADDEPELGTQPVIASVSLGAERDLLFRRSVGRARGERSLKLRLPHGSLLLMSGATQHLLAACPATPRACQRAADQPHVSQDTDG